MRGVTEEHVIFQGTVEDPAGVRPTSSVFPERSLVCVECQGLNGLKKKKNTPRVYVVAYHSRNVDTPQAQA